MKLAPIVSALAALLLAACQQQPKPAEEKSTASASASSQEAKGPNAKPGLQLEGGRLVLPAVKGNPGVAYFMLDNSSSATVQLASISINGSEKSQMHQTVEDTMTTVDSVEIAPGTSIAFEPGSLHVMVFNLAPRLQAGGTTEMTLTFGDGDKLSAPLKIEAPGSGSHQGAMH
ncbi:MAG: copper chaperone PCu(A)C [Novosphingobium sp.]